MIKIAVTEQEYHKAGEVFLRAREDGLECICAGPLEASLANAIRQQAIRHVIIGVERYAGPLYQALAKGSVVARFGVGHDGVDKAQATAHGVLCTNTPGALDASVAEHTINLVLAGARQLPAQACAVRAGKWSPQIGTELQGKRLGIIGCGEIGRRVARIAAFGFGMEVVGFRRSQTNEPSPLREFGFQQVVGSFEEAVRLADFVSLHLPSLPETRHFLGRDRLKMLPGQSWVINTGRGALIDEEALFDALANHQLAGAALDVFEREPYVPVSPEKDLRSLPHVVMTPHISSSTREANRRMALQCLANIKSAEARRYGEMNLLNPEVLQKL